VWSTLKTTRELGIGFTAYAPLGRGLLTGAVRGADDIKGDRRGEHPRFVGDSLTRNLALVAKIAAVAREKGCTPGQLVLAWLLAQGDDIVPIPGTKRKERVDENLDALAVKLTPPRSSASPPRYRPAPRRARAIPRRR
jgi:aryl-alcohol dehydrogenase-like predicted oxidoreductase